MNKFKFKNVKYINDVGPQEFAKTIAISKVSLNILRPQINSHTI